jgi:hypothetical protein
LKEHLVANRKEFASALAERDLTHVDRAVALLWFYRQTQEFEERAPSELAADLHDEDFPKPNVGRLKKDLTRSPFTIRGKRSGTFQIDVRRLAHLDTTYGPLIRLKTITPSDTIIPAEWVSGTRPYLVKLVQQINTCYDSGMYDASAVLCRRLMESLIIEVYVSQKRHAEIQQGGTFIQLGDLIRCLLSDSSIPKSKALRATPSVVKDVGDTAAHDRTYITRQTDIESFRLNFGRTISELLRLSGIRP